MELILVRHCETPANEEHQYVGGRSDPSLSARGRERATRMRSWLAGLLTDEIWTSDLRRAQETASLIAPGVPQKSDRRLRELDFGVFEGRSFQQNLRVHGPAFQAWIDDPNRCSPPAGESVAELMARIAAWLEEIDPAERAIAVIHGGPIRAILSCLLGLDFYSLRGLSLPPGAALRFSNPRSSGVLDVLTEAGEWRTRSDIASTTSSSSGN